MLNPEFSSSEFANFKNPKRESSIEAPPKVEDQETFANQNILVLSSPDAHGVSMAVSSAKYLENKGAKTVIYAGSPVIHGGVGTTHPGAFYEKTLPNLDVSKFQRVVVADIPLNSKDAAGSQAALTALSEKLQTQNTDLSDDVKPQHPVLYLDHHGVTDFEQQHQALAIKNSCDSYGCRLGDEEDLVARIGAICDRDPTVLPITNEEATLAKGLDVAVRPDTNLEKPKLPTDATQEEIDEYKKNLAVWETAAQQRLLNAINELKNENWDYFQEEAAKVKPVEIPTFSGFGQTIVVDTQNLTAGFMVLKNMESAIETAGVNDNPYAIAVLRELRDDKLGREPADVVSIIRHWTRNDLPTVEEVIKANFGQEFIDQYNIYGAPNAKTMRLTPPNDRHTAEMVTKLLEAFAGKEMPDFSQIKSVVMCGDPNSGKSVYSTIFREALKNFGVKVAHLDLDKAAPTPQWYLDAEINNKQKEALFAQGKISYAEVETSREQLQQAAAKRKAMKRPWSIELAQEAKDELIAANNDENIDFIIGDIGGGKIKKDENGKIVKITRLTAENAKILEAADAVIIVSNNPDGAAEWRTLLETGEDPETGVKIQREKPISIIGTYHSILEGSKQRVADKTNSGIITNLDRSKAEKKYNPTILSTALFVSKAIEKRRAQESKNN